jgi:hypothetical protein
MMSHVDDESYNQQVLLQLDPPIAGVFVGQAAIRVNDWKLILGIVCVTFLCL